MLFIPLWKRRRRRRRRRRETARSRDTRYLLLFIFIFLFFSPWKISVRSVKRTRSSRKRRPFTMTVRSAIFGVKKRQILCVCVCMSVCVRLLFVFVFVCGVVHECIESRRWWEDGWKNDACVNVWQNLRLDDENIYAARAVSSAEKTGGKKKSGHRSASEIDF